MPTMSNSPATTSAAITTPPIAYLLSRYPAVSHTFFLHEVLGLRALGMHIETASVNLPDRSQDKLSDAERAEVARTLYLKAGSKAGAALGVLGIALRHPGVTLRGLRATFSVRNLTLSGRALWLAYFAEALVLGHWMHRRQLKHLHVHFGGAVASVGLLTSIAWQVPYSLTIHGPEELQNTHSYHLREKLRQASFVVCISDFCRSQLMQITPVSAWNKFTVVRLGVPLALVEQPSMVRAAAEPVQLLCVGRLVPDKGQHLLLRATVALVQRGIQLRLTLAGDGPDRPALQAAAASLGLSDLVTFAGAIPHAEALRLCAQADIFVLPSFAEGIPVALMEAMALGVPCVSTVVAGIPELIRHGHDGLLVSPSNVDALTEALATLAGSPTLRHTLGHSARERVRTMYDLATNQRELAHLFATKLAPSKETAC